MLLMPVRANSIDESGNKIGSVDYNNLPEKFNQLISRQSCEYYSLALGYYLLIPLASGHKNKLENLNYVMRVFSNEKIHVEEVQYDDESKFLTSDLKIVNIIARKCNFCEKLIDGKYTHTDNFVYHGDCYEKLNLCDFCQKLIESTFYPMNQSLKCCKNCYDFKQERINSAKIK